MINLCDYCSKRGRCYKLIKLNTALLKEIDSSPKVHIYAEVMVNRCRVYKPKKHIEREIEHICYSCKNQETCSLWDQVCNIDEDFIKSAFDYDPEIQSVCSTVSYCKLYQPKEE